MKKIVLLFLVFASIKGIAQTEKTQVIRFSKPKISGGTLWSDVIPPIEGSYTDLSQSYGLSTEDYDEYSKNTWKRGFYVETGTDVRLSKRIRLEGNLVYQERKALEVFAFFKHEVNDEDLPFRNGSEVTYINVPTSEQSEGFDSNIDKPLDNFKYFGFELVPVAEYGERLKMRIGVGMYAIFLLNRNKLVFDKDDFPRYSYLFEPPQTAFGKVKYTESDGGFVLKTSLKYSLGDKVSIGLTGKYYWSKSILNGTLQEDRGWLRSNLRWTTYLAGLDFFYSF